MKWTALASSLLFLLLSTPVIADELPKGAMPLESAELRNIYSGKSVVWANRDGAYFASNGKVKMVFTNFNDGKDRWSGYGSGNWSVKGNRVCWNVSGAGMSLSTHAVEPFSGHAACWEWYKSGSTYYTKWSRRGGYKTTVKSKFRSGDRISRWHEDYKAKLKR